MSGRRITIAVVTVTAVLVMLLPTLAGRGAAESYLTDWLRLAVLATSFLWIAGLAGRLALSHHAFLGVGGYLAAIAVFEFGVHPLLGTLAALVAAAVITWLVSAASVRFRIRDLSFALLTIAVAEILRFTFLQAESKWFVGGIALPLVEDPWRLSFFERTSYFYVYAVLLGACLGAHAWFVRSRWGRQLAAVRDDDTAAESLGQRLLVWTFVPYVAASIVAVLVGTITVQEQLSVRTDALFDINLLIQVITAGVLGGMGSWIGGVLGAAAVVAVDQLVIAVSLDDVVGASLMVYGLLVVLVVLFVPGGLAGFAGKQFAHLRARRHGGREQSSSRKTAPAPVQANGTDGVPAWLVAEPKTLSVSGMRVVFGGLTAVDDVDVTASPGRIHAIIGPNGAGKTTLFNSVTGVVQADGGQVELDGHDITGNGPAERSRLGIRRTFQLPRLFESLTVVENLEVGSSKHDGAAGPDEVLATLGIPHLSGCSVGELTTGERRMVELARALAGRPSVLLVDETFAGLSPSEAQHVTTTLLRCKEAGMSVLLVEHVLSAVRALADHLYVLDQGRLLQEGDPETVLGSKEVRVAYLGEVT